jgi:hypothetical protein
MLGILVLNGSILPVVNCLVAPLAIVISKILSKLELNVGIAVALSRFAIVNS